MNTHAKQFNNKTAYPLQQLSAIDLISILSILILLRLI